MIAYANGLPTTAIEKILFLSNDQIRRSRGHIYRKLGVPPGTSRSMPLAVATAWRACLIEADEIEGGPVELAEIGEERIHYALGDYLASMRRLPPPRESWAELRARAARIADEYRRRG